jgi:hypothetical protein
MRRDSRLALYTTVYPGIEPYLPSWYQSVESQTDKGFDLWIGVDALDIEDSTRILGSPSNVHWVTAKKHGTPTQIRQEAIQQMVGKYPAVIFVDSDDLLDPTRVEGARESLRSSDVSGCAMRIIDEKGSDLGSVFKIPEEMSITDALTRVNAFGLTNTVYRSKTLEKCLPIPTDCVLVDWFLIMRAWAFGARISFDNTCRMMYRQHSNNLARVLPPFTAHYIHLITKLVLNHYQSILETALELSLGSIRTEILAIRKEIVEFSGAMDKSPEVLERYVSSLNQFSAVLPWWATVAHPKLEAIWKEK